jgi:hypothetical protein
LNATVLLSTVKLPFPWLTLSEIGLWGPR